MPAAKLPELIAKVEEVRKCAIVLEEVESVLDEVLDYLRYQLPATSAPQFDVVVEAYHRRLPMLPHIRALTEPRRRALRARLAENAEPKWWDDYFARVARSEFLTGRKTGVQWTASFDWLLKPANMQKVTEGNYDPPRAGGLSAGDEAAYAMSQPFAASAK